MAEKTLDDLFLDTLKDIYFAEKQILKALPKMARAAQSEEGKAAFLKHRDETDGQIQRLQQGVRNHRQGCPRQGPAKPSRASSPKARKLWKNTRARSPSMLG